MSFSTKSMVRDYKYEQLIKLKESRFGEICKPLADKFGCKVSIVGGGIRQLVREIQWNGVVPKDIDAFVGKHSRDFDILIETDRDLDPWEAEIEALLETKLRSIMGWRCIEMDVIVKGDYYQDIDLWSNAVSFDGEWLGFVALEVGEDYLNTDNHHYKKATKSARDFLKLRWLINHSWYRPGNKQWFKGENQDVGILRENFYYETYLRKIEQLKGQYNG